MELKTQVVFVAALLVCSAIASSEAVTCYICTSVLESGCSDPFKSDGIETCTGASCAKFAGSGANGTSVVIRSCSGVPSSKNECEEGSQSGVKGVVCICTSDRCNGAKSIIPSAGLLVVVGGLSMSAAIRS